MLKLHLIVSMFSVGMMVLGTGGVSGQDYPNKPIRIVTLSTGSGPDFASRLIAKEIAGPMGQQVIVDNRPTSVIPGEIVAKAPPDGYTLLVASGGLWIGPLIGEYTPYDALRDFSPITLASRSPSFLVVHPSLPVKSVKELIVLAKGRPGALNYASGTSGGADHLAAELFKYMAGVDIVRVSYRIASMRMAALIGGEMQVGFSSSTSATPHVKSGKLRALAVTSAERSALFPHLPVVAATLPGYETVQITNVFAPAKTPATIINRLNQEIVRALQKQVVKEAFSNSGIEAVGSSPEQLVATIKSDMAKMGRMIKDVGIRAE